MAITGLALVAYLILHLIGNLLLYAPTGTPFNSYAHKIMSIGPLLYVAEVGLALIILVHAFTGIRVTLKNRKARPQQYLSTQTKGGSSFNNISSRSMAIAGVILLGFIILHVWQFRFGPGVAEGYATNLPNGETIRDLYALVNEIFHNPVYVFIYVGSMLAMGLHLRHGFWSLFQSMGAMNKAHSKKVYAVGAVLALILTIGFLMIPVAIYFDWPQLFFGGVIQ